MFVQNNINGFFGSRKKLWLFAKECNYKNILFTGWDNSKKNIFPTNDGSKVVRMLSSIPLISGILNTAKLLFICKIYSPKIVFIFNTKSLFYFGIVSLIYRNKETYVISTITGLGYTRQSAFIKRFAGAYILKLVDKYSNVVYTQNRHNHLYYIKFFHKNKSTKVKLLTGSGVDSNLFNTLKKNKKSSQHKIIKVAFCGRYTHSKGYYDYLKVVEGLDKSIFKCYTCGEASKIQQNQPFVKYTNKSVLHLPYNIGYVNKINQFLREVDILVFPSKYGEGIPRIVLEGMASGCIIICYNEPWCKDFKKWNPSGFYFQNKSVADILKTLRRMKSNLHCFDQQKESNRAIVKEYFDQDTVIRNYTNYLKKYIVE